MLPLRQRLTGPTFSIITPFKDDESLDTECLSNYVKFLYRNGARVFYIMVYNSRFSLL